MVTAWHMQNHGREISYLLDNLGHGSLNGRHPLNLLSLAVTDVRDGCSAGGQLQGVGFASGLPPSADISHLAEVHHAPGLGGGRHICCGKAEQVALLEDEPSAPPILDVLPLGQHEAGLLGAVPESNLIDCG